jgi:chromate transporter
MSDSTPSAVPPAEPDAPSAVAAVAASPLSIAALFLAFAVVSISSFGGVLAWARRMLVEKQRLDDGAGVQ